MSTQFNKLPERIRHIRKKMAWTQEDVAKICGLTNSGVSAWERGRVGISTDAALAISSESGFAVEWIRDGEGPMMASESNVETYVLSGRKVPLISEVQAGMWGDIVDTFAPGDAEVWIQPSTKVGKHSFALKVTSDSMTNPNGFPTFPEGIVLIVDPDIEASSGAFVIVGDGLGGCTFKQLRVDGSQRMLVPLNPRWPIQPFPPQGRIIGVVKAAQFNL